MPAADSIQVRRALLSVSDKTKLIGLCSRSHDLGVQLISTGARSVLQELAYRNKYHL